MADKRASDYEKVNKRLNSALLDAYLNVHFMNIEIEPPSGQGLSSAEHWVEKTLEAKESLESVLDSDISHLLDQHLSKRVSDLIDLLGIVCTMFDSTVECDGGPPDA